MLKLTPPPIIKEDECKCGWCRRIIITESEVVKVVTHALVALRKGKYANQALTVWQNSQRQIFEKCQEELLRSQEMTDAMVSHLREFIEDMNELKKSGAA